MAKYILAIDQGTTGTTVALVDGQDVLCHQAAEYPPTALISR